MKDALPPWMPSLVDMIETIVSAARHQAFEEAAVIAHCYADDRRGRDRPADWHDGYMDGCLGAATAIRARMNKEPKNDA